MVSLTQLQEIPPRKAILLVGPPGAGKTSFCEQAILHSLAIDRPVIYATTEFGPSEAEKALRERGLLEIEPGLLSFIDAYNETVGVSVEDRPDTTRADCEDLSSLGMAISKLQERVGRKNILLVFDSLTSPYLFNSSEILRFIRRTLSRFTSSGNSVLAFFDEGSGKEEDLVAMMSLLNGVIKMELKEGKSVLDIVKHPQLKPTRIEISTTDVWERMYDVAVWDRAMIKRFFDAMQSGTLAREFSEYAVNGFWPSLAKWSSILWEPRRFPKMMYEVSVEQGSLSREMISLFPWYMRLLFKLRIPKSFSKPRDMRKMLKIVDKQFMKSRRYCILEYLDDISKTDEHHIRMYECSECWGFENVGAPLASWLPPTFAAFCKGFESEEREWNAIETKCIGLGDPYCEFKLVPGEIDTLKDHLETIDSIIIERVYNRLLDRLMGFMLHGKPLWERPRLGSDLFAAGMEMGTFTIASERYRTALRMGGAKSGKEVGKRLMDAGLGDEKAVKRIIGFLEYCRVGKVSVDESIEIKENYESWWTKVVKLFDEPSCFFTTGFLNGFFSAVKNQHVKEIRCIAIGDPYCEWEFR